MFRIQNTIQMFCVNEKKVLKRFYAEPAQAQIHADENADDDVGLFDFSQLTRQTQNAFKVHDYSTLTPIQAATLPFTTKGEDVIGRAFTGTGKTLAYLLPLAEAQHLNNARAAPRNPTAIVLCPTRELAIQVMNDVEKFLPFKKGVCVYGGSSYETQSRALNRGCDIVVGTPGRVQDLINKGYLSLENLKLAVLDEADTMLQFGFQEDVEQILSKAPPPGERQTLLFSATFPGWVDKIAKRMMSNPITIDLVGDKGVTTAETLKHAAIQLPNFKGSPLTMYERVIADLLHVHSQGARVIVFAPTKTMTQQLSESKTFQSFGARALHGDMSQSVRELTMRAFRDNKFSILVATDVAARGLDVPEVDVVIHLEAPTSGTEEMYVHRAGRAGRAGRDGLSIMLYSQRNAQDLKRLERFINHQFEKWPLLSANKVMTGAAKLTIERLQKIPQAPKQFFREIAEEFYNDQGIDGVAAAIASLSGFETLATDRSMLTGSLTHTTIQFNTTESYFKQMLFDQFPPLERIKSYPLKSRNGFIMDIPQKFVGAVLDFPNQLPKDMEVDIHKVSVLPDVIDFDEQSSRGGGRGGRGGGRGGGGRGGG
eukprot:CAMPEP_0168594530 /NCGR_PEP_ID=MMETSP0420-20121227/8951_1 /TAXON_ID=498008 /ORGANISM="Pessonella sp." /LENGTH=596 /DNA_ID=CAMNT_0008630863 /DNA_START=122 /DNA_END=1907 /DNA_ORIENTATION=-